MRKRVVLFYVDLQVKELGPIMRGKKETENYRFLLNLGKHFLIVIQVEILKWISLPNEKVGISCPENKQIGLGTL